MYIDQLAAILAKSERVVFFGGAGVSTASGIPDFRSAEGIFSKQWNRSFSPEELVSHTFYKKHPQEFFRYYKTALVHPNAKPNPCHTALAELEEMGKISAVVTQNIDGLHQLAGSKNVIELHGSVHRNYCETCRSFYDLEYILGAEGIPLCSKCGGRVKPDVVLYEESLNTHSIENAVNQIAHADTLIVGGTSLIVYPAAGLVRYFGGRHCVLINKNSTSLDHRVDLVIQEDIAAVFQSVMDRLRAM